MHSLFLQKMPLAVDSAMPFSLARQQIILTAIFVLLCENYLAMQYITLLAICIAPSAEISFCKNQWDRSTICMFRQQMLRRQFFWPTQRTGEMISLHFGRIENELCFEG
ncbi:hypothetical protein [Rhizobium laguerreae]|uniref:hypothetical protein n=1 Tax=Rhizobium laguerreae TaxID=1076926 RepID=UPI0010527975|nr:hypothetical protein [Rhizobium laguerreae]